MFLVTLTSFLTSIGWALLHSIWQFGLLYLVYWLFSNFIVYKRTGVKHAMALVFLLVGLVLFISAVTTSFINTYPVAVTPETNQWWSGFQYGYELLNGIVPWVTLVYFMLLVFYFMKLNRVMITSLSLKNKPLQKLPVAWRIYIEKQVGLLGIKKKVKAFIAHHIDTPQVIGILKPVILVPASCITHLSTTQLEAILLHELIHVKRNDFLINIIVTITELIFFFNPFVKNLVRAVRKEREYHCDDWVIQFQFRPDLYAAALLQLEKNRSDRFVFGVAASGNGDQQLLQRIKRLLGQPYQQYNWLKTGLSCFIVTLVAASLLVSPVFTTAPGVVSGGQIAAGSVTNPAVTPEIAAIITTKPEALKKYKQALDDVNKIAPLSSSEDDLFTLVNLFPENTSLPVSAIQNEALAYSITEPVTEVPDEVKEKLTYAPFVPSSSFDYLFFEDTSKPKEKTSAAELKKLRELTVQMNTALEKINWDALSEELKETLNHQQLEQLKKTLLGQLTTLNSKLAQQKVLAAREEAIKMADRYRQQQQAIKEHQLQQSYLDALQQRLQQQEQLLEDATEKQKADVKKLLEQQQQLNKELKKRRIIYL